VKTYHFANPRRRLHEAQAGFTLLELLIAMSIVLLMVVSIQRYVAGVLGDREHLSAQQDQTNQINVILSNIQNDVARAGFIPIASVASFTQAPSDSTTSLGNVGVKVRPCVGNHCEGNELWLAYWTQDNPAYDCLHNMVVTPRTSGWVRVENIYQFRQYTLSAPLVLGCDGNGGSSGGNWEGLSNDVDGDIQDFNWTLDTANGDKSLLHFCMNTRMHINNHVSGGSQPQSCVANTDLPASATQVYQTINMDMLVRTPLPQTQVVAP
jgi:prepilin-type N-terminal cleavage/methylation domain-containing protein